jgi:general secretion pathway protein G
MLKHLRATDEWAAKNALQKGFTLVELLVVITILGILAAVVVFAVNGISDNGQVSACKADKQTLTTAIEAYRAKNGVSATPTEAQLKSGGLLADVSTYYDISWAGTTYTISPQSGSPCT